MPTEARIPPTVQYGKTVALAGAILQNKANLLGLK
jgi:hypothetical protein